MSDFTEIEKQYREGTLKPGYVTTGILIDIIEKQREMIAEDEDYLGHKKYCQMGEIIDLGNDVTDTMDCTCGYNEILRKRTCETIKLTEE